MSGLWKDNQLRGSRPSSYEAWKYLGLFVCCLHFSFTFVNLSLSLLTHMFRDSIRDISVLIPMPEAWCEVFRASTSVV